jgi:hypothetical protein
LNFFILKGFYISLIFLALGMYRKHAENVNISPSRPGIEEVACEAGAVEAAVGCHHSIAPQLPIGWRLNPEPISEAASSLKVQ